jgi:diaminohydroxyphosphoribosylaminopyrimidine deaminase/5-amino-6-(5-phosphoribosylamino)uracil reductase
MGDRNAFDETLMRRALELARRGIGHVEPNPAVGAVIADDDGNVLGEGWHERFGGPHAEVHALSSAGQAARGANLFVTLEPCCHFGKTPPCTQAVIAAGIRRVVVATTDPATHASGRGIEELKAAGIEVEVGLLGDEARRLIASFTRLMTTGLPWMHAKWAMTLDGKIATATGSSQWITNPSSRAVVHQLRGRMDAILTGVGTVLADDPQLTARPAGPRIATRIVLDSLCRLPVDSRLVRTAKDVPVLVATSEFAPSERIDALRQAGVEVLQLPGTPQRHPDPLELARELGRRRMTNVLIEAGGQILGSVFDLGLINEVHAFIAPSLIGGRDAPTPIGGTGLENMANAIRLEQTTLQMLDGDVYIHGPLAPVFGGEGQGEGASIECQPMPLTPG